MEDRRLKPRPTGLASPIRKPLLRGLGYRDWGWVDSGVSKALEAFVASLATICRNSGHSSLSTAAFPLKSASLELHRELNGWELRQLGASQFCRELDVGCLVAGAR